jgi:hypothetical protein
MKMRLEERNIHMNVTHEDEIIREMRSERSVYVNVTHEDEIRGEKCLCDVYDIREK